MIDRRAALQLEAELRAAVTRLMRAALSHPKIEVTVDRRDLELLLTVCATKTKTNV